MINTNFETDAREYIKSGDSLLFEEKLYLPLTYMAEHTCEKYKVSPNEFANTINDLVSEVSIQLPIKFQESKCTYVKTFVYTLMSHWLNDNIRYKGAGKRDHKKLVYLEDLTNSTPESVHIIEIEFDELSEMKEVLQHKRQLFNDLSTALKRKIAFKIVDYIQTPVETELSYVAYISKQCKCKKTSVYGVIREMHSIVTAEK
jgi:hypothetical protein